MRDLMASCCIAFSMYSRLPVPQTEWTEKNMKYALCFFPFIGVIIGTLFGGFHVLAVCTGLIGSVAYACIGTAIPLLVTGGIHMDGFLDTADALCSYQSRERKLEILKDPHTGAFAVIWGLIYLLLTLAAVSELENEAFPAAAGIFVISRAFSGWSVVSLPKAKQDGLASAFSAGAEHRAVQTAMIFWGMAAAVWMIANAGAARGLAVLLAQAAVFFWYCRMAHREFGGVTGDLAGFFLQVCELAGLSVLAIACQINI